jgi:hypothetical protein
MCYTWLTIRNVSMCSRLGSLVLLSVAQWDQKSKDKRRIEVRYWFVGANREVKLKGS